LNVLHGQTFFYSAMKQFYVYIHASKRNGTLYNGMTSDLLKRVYEHKEHLVEGFTKKYKVEKLVYFEIHETAENAIISEKRLKKWKREWKLKLIEERNSNWNDLYEQL
jgi:putative endonuclease